LPSAHRRPVDQAGDALQPAIGTNTRRQQRLRQASLPDPSLTHRRLAFPVTRSSESAFSRPKKAFRRGLHRTSPMAPPLWRQVPFPP
jgi:hypothetical protein